jgi:hypothetical protein
MFAKRLGALVATGLGLSRHIGALTSEPPPAGTLAVHGGGETEAATGSSANGLATLTTAETSRLSTTRESGPYTVAVRSESFPVVGDSGFLAPENARRADNGVFIGNLADFLVSGDAPDVSFEPPTEPGGGTPPSWGMPPGGPMPPEPPEPPENATA